MAGWLRNPPSSQSAPPGGKGVRVNAVQAERWTESKSLRDFSVSLVPPHHRKGGYRLILFSFDL